jgi:hypothetical protein
VYINNKWTLGTVVDMDCSLVKLQIKSSFFKDSALQNENGHRTSPKSPSVNHMFSVWFFRGSFCLYPLYEKMLQKIKNNYQAVAGEPDTPLTDYEVYLKEKRADNLIESNNKTLWAFASTVCPCNPPRSSLNSINSKFNLLICWSLLLM